MIGYQSMVREAERIGLVKTNRREEIGDLCLALPGGFELIFSDPRDYQLFVEGKTLTVKSKTAGQTAVNLPTTPPASIVGYYNTSGYQLVNNRSGETLHQAQHLAQIGKTYSRRLCKEAGRQLAESLDGEFLGCTFTSKFPN